MHWIGFLKGGREILKGNEDWLVLGPQGAGSIKDF